jgi:hypothetical protein
LQVERSLSNGHRTLKNSTSSDNHASGVIKIPVREQSVWASRPSQW